MARARTAPGTHGEVTIIGQARTEGRWVKVTTKPERYRAMTRYCDRDGVTHLVERFASTKGEARRKLNQALAGWDATVSAEQRRTETTLSEAAATWLEQVERSHKLSDKSKSLYRGMWERCVAGTDLAALQLSDANTVPVLRTFLQGIADERGTGTAKSVRSVLSGILQLAVDDGLLPTNGTRSVRSVTAKSAKATERDTRRALTKKQREHLLSVASKHERALAADVADIIAYMAATGVRISEALGQRWEDVTLSAGTVHVKGTKSGAADRTLALPEWMVERLQARVDAQGTDGLIFPSPGTTDRDKVRDLRNVARVFREVLDAAGLPWATPHSLRRTVATLIHEAGYPVTAAQAQLGHADASMTMRVYLARRDEPSRDVAAVL